MHYLFLIIAITVIANLLVVLVLSAPQEKRSKDTQASSSDTIVTTKANWDAGTLVSVDSDTPPGDAKIDLTASKVTAGEITNEGEGDPENARDADFNTSVHFTVQDQGVVWDMQNSYYVASVRMCVNSGDIMGGVQLYYGGAWNYGVYEAQEFCTNGQWWGGTQNMAGVSKVRVATMDMDIGGFNVYVRELEIYANGTATHTSASTQIGDVSSDPGRYVVEYNGFDTTETEPANTAIDYRFQLVNASGVSTDGWTAWASGDVTDLATAYPSQLTLSQTKIDAGETYLQVQSRLTTTDGVSTPTLSDYTASYHTNKAPNTPTPQ